MTDFYATQIERLKASLFTRKPYFGVFSNTYILSSTNHIDQPINDVGL